MEKMGFVVTRLQIVLIFCLGLHTAYGVPTTTASFTPKPAVKGDNSHSVMCSYTTGSGDVFQSVILTREMQSILILDISNTTSWYSGPIVDAIRQRATKFGSLSTNMLGIAYNNTLCSDEVLYKCEIAVKIGDAIQPSVINNMTVSIEAPPQTPVQMTVNPNIQSIQEFTSVTFTCFGNVGKPAGTFYWYMFTAANGVNPDNVTSQASTESPVSSVGDCTFTRRSSLTIRLLRKHMGLVVRCRVYHPTFVNSANLSDCTNPSAQFCQSSQTITVTYPVNVTVDAPFREEGEGKSMTLTCTAEANPTPWFEWFKDDSNITLSKNYQLTLNNLTLADSGDYICMGYNNISGVIYNASATVSVTVVPTTTPPPTTTTTRTTTTTKATTQSVSATGTTAPVKGDSTNIAAIVAPIVVGVVVIIVVVILIWYCCCKRKERSELEEWVKNPTYATHEQIQESHGKKPPEKPFNNNASINTKATQPDLVSNDKMYHISDSNILKSQDGLDYAEFYNQPRSRRPLTLDETGDYNSVSMPQV